MPDNWFSHSGDLGDIIYSLPAIRACGGGEFYLFHSHGKTMHGMNRERFELIRPLLEVQPYITKVGYWEPHEAVDHNLNGFRNHYEPGRVLADCHLAALGKSNLERNAAWITAPKPIAYYPIIFHRSPRYRNDRFDWKRIWERYRPYAVFVGLSSEHRNFTEEVGPIPFVGTNNLLDLARMIAGCKLFVGNQSCPFAIAEGLKQNAILEVYPGCNNCCYPRINVLHGWDNSIALPEVPGCP